MGGHRLVEEEAGWGGAVGLSSSPALPYGLGHVGRVLERQRASVTAPQGLQCVQDPSFLA